MGARRNLAGVVAAALLLSSCIGFDSRVTFKGDGSGSLRIEYRLSKEFWDLDKQSGSQLPVIVDEQELRQALAQAKGLELVALNRREDEKDVFVTAEIRFDRIEALAATEAFDDMPMSLERAGDDFVFRQTVTAADEEQPAPAPGAPQADPQAAAADKEIEEMFAGVLKGYEVALAVNAPRPIKSHSAGELSADRKSVSWRLPLDRLMEIPRGTVLTVTW